jgi:hypothetical protein
MENNTGGEMLPVNNTGGETLPVKVIKEKGKIPYPLRILVFSEIKGKEYKDVEKELGEEILYVTIIFIGQKALLRCNSKNKQAKDTPFTDKERARMLKMFKVKEETIAACNSIFVCGNMKKKTILVTQNRKDGTTKEITI